MEISWFGHSCFRIKGKGTKLITDPPSRELGYSGLGKLTANIVTLSHHHRGHDCVDALGPGSRVIDGPGEYQIGDTFITGIGTFHDAEGGAKRGKNTIYLIEMDDLVICHLGDLGHVPSAQQVEEFGHIEVLMLPVGGVSTLDAVQAARTVRMLEPKIAIPMHFGTEVVTWLEPANKFLKEMGIRELKSQSRLSVTKSSVPNETRVVLLDYHH